MQLSAVKPAQIPLLLVPHYASRHDARELERAGLIQYDDQKEEYGHTDEGQAVAKNVREAYGMTWDGQISGGGRWVVAGRELHCGNALEIMLADGSWKSVRFEVEFSGKAKAQATNGRLPVLYIGLAGGGSLICHFDVDTLFRWPKS